MIFSCKASLRIFTGPIFILSSGVPIALGVCDANSTRLTDCLGSVSCQTMPPLVDRMELGSFCLFFLFAVLVNIRPADRMLPLISSSMTISLGLLDPEAPV